MNKTKRILIFILVVFCMSIPTLKANDTKRKAFREIVGKIISKFEKKYDLYAYATGSQNVNGIKQIRLGFFKYHPMTLEECRDIMVKCLIEFEDIINSDRNAKKYSIAYPNPLDNVSMSIIIANVDGSDILHPEIESVSYYQYQLDYTTLDPENPFDDQLIIEEPYEEAKAIVTKNNKESQ